MGKLNKVDAINGPDAWTVVVSQRDKRNTHMGVGYCVASGKRQMRAIRALYVLDALLGAGGCRYLCRRVDIMAASLQSPMGDNTRVDRKIGALYDKSGPSYRNMRYLQGALSRRLGQAYCSNGCAELILSILFFGKGPATIYAT